MFGVFAIDDAPSPLRALSATLLPAEVQVNSFPNSLDSFLTRVPHVYYLVRHLVWANTQGRSMQHELCEDGYCLRCKMWALRGSLCAPCPKCPTLCRQSHIWGWSRLTGRTRALFGRWYHGMAARQALGGWVDGGDQHFRFSAIERKHLRSVKLDALWCWFRCALCREV